jgi:hypothetical protein
LPAAGPPVGVEGPKLLNGEVVLIGAEIFLQVAVRSQIEDAGEVERLSQRLLVFYGIPDFEMVEVRAPVALNYMKRFTMGLPRIIEPAPIVESDSIHHQCVSVPMGYGITGPAFRIDFEIVRSPIEKESPVAMSITFRKQNHKFGSLDNLIWTFRDPYYSVGKTIRSRIVSGQISLVRRPLLLRCGEISRIDGQINTAVYDPNT